MGYSIYLIDRNKPITEELVDDIIANELPKRLMGYFPNYKQSWGWSMKTDLKIKEKSGGHKYLSVSGSFGGSGEWALDMVVVFQQLLQRKGYLIEIFSNDFGFCNKDLYDWLGYDSKELVNEPNF